MTREEGWRAGRESGAGDGWRGETVKSERPQRRRRRSGVMERVQRGRAGDVFMESWRESDYSLSLFPKDPGLAPAGSGSSL